MAPVNPIADTYPRVTPHLSIAGAAEAIDFYTSVLGANERMRMAMPDGTVAHAEIVIGGSVIMIGDESWPGATSPARTLWAARRSRCSSTWRTSTTSSGALEAGAAAVQDPEDHFYGDRVAMFDDPYGHRWNLGTHIEHVPPEELERRAAEVMSTA
jgi:PhnB protein